MTMSLRQRNIAGLGEETLDVLVIGGGINGAVSAAALAGHGAKVAIIDRGDFAGETSEHSSNLAWGGIKYLETFEFSLVRQLCRSRNQLLRSYPSSVREIRFLTTLPRGFRHHPLKLWAGTWLYWLMGNGFTQAPRLLNNRKISTEEPVIDTRSSIAGFEYSDAYLIDNDARFVFDFVRNALDRGATAINYLEATGCERTNGLWQVQVQDRETGQHHRIRARALVNAAGPFADRLNGDCGRTTEHRHVFSKGIHLIVNRLTREDRVLAFFASDGRPFFVIPMGDKTCIGTTDTRVEAPETEVTDADRDFVLENINRCIRLPKPLTHADIIAERCGVRPLAVSARGTEANTSDFLQLSRRHELDIDRTTAHITIFGGKLTDCLNVGEEICAAVSEMGITLHKPETPWYGEPDSSRQADFQNEARRLGLDAFTSPGAENLSARLWRRYGERAFPMLHAIAEDPNQADIMLEGSSLLRCEIEHAAEHEMIVQLEDFLRRRTMLSQTRRHEELQTAHGMREICEILFGEQAIERFTAYFPDAEASPKGQEPGQASHGPKVASNDARIQIPVTALVTE